MPVQTVARKSVSLYGSTVMRLAVTSCDTYAAQGHELLSAARLTPLSSTLYIVHFADSLIPASIPTKPASSREFDHLLDAP
eukprot:4113624-Pleurochrysis_carterae.AAC.1